MRGFFLGDFLLSLMACTLLRDDYLTLHKGQTHSGVMEELERALNYMSWDAFGGGRGGGGGGKTGRPGVHDFSEYLHKVMGWWCSFTSGGRPSPR